jgi:hypothetical protein
LLDAAPETARDVAKIPKSSPRYPVRLALRDLGYEKLDVVAAKKVAGKVHQIPVYAMPTDRPQYEQMRPIEIYDLVSSALAF